MSLGILAGLVLGKPLAISLFAWLSVRLRIARLPENVGWRHLHAASWLGGIGFTMFLFIASLAYRSGELLAAAKSAILLSSLIAALAGSLFLRRTSRRICLLNLASGP